MVVRSEQGNNVNVHSYAKVFPQVVVLKSPLPYPFLASKTPVLYPFYTLSSPMYWLGFQSAPTQARGTSGDGGRWEGKPRANGISWTQNPRDTMSSHHMVWQDHWSLGTQTHDGRQMGSELIILPLAFTVEHWVKGDHLPKNSDRTKLFIIFYNV